MRALSVRQPWASMIARGEKVEECRSRPTHVRGPVLICASRAGEGGPRGVAVCVVEIVGCRPTHDGYAWQLARPRPVAPWPVSGKLGFYEVPEPPPVLAVYRDGEDVVWAPAGEAAPGRLLALASAEAVEWAEVTAGERASVEALLGGVPR